MVRINVKVAAGALAAGDVQIGDITEAATDVYRLMTIKASYSWAEVGAIIDDGFTFGVCHGDYTAAEVEECLEAQGALDRGDKIELEKSNRLVREIGTIASLQGGTSTGSMVFANGRPVKTKLNWYMSAGDKLKGWIRNNSTIIWSNGSALGVHGAIWVKDSV